jgi:hypothetical protein
MPMGEGTYGNQVGRPKKQKNSTDNYAQTQRGTGQNSTDNMNDGPIDKKIGGTYRRPGNYAEMQRKKLAERRREFQLEMQSRKRKEILKKLKQKGTKRKPTKRDG